MPAHDLRRHATVPRARACPCASKVDRSSAGPRELAEQRQSGLSAEPRTVIVIMAKAPAMGCKTRLCPPLTLAEAAALSEALLRDTIALVAAREGVQLAIAVSPPEASPAVARLCPPDALLLPVTGRDIGDCLDQVLGQLLDAGHGAAYGVGYGVGYEVAYSAAIALNSDGPTLPAAYLQAAVDRLAEADVVLGPSDDGGYYLIGLKRPAPGLFQDIDWSTSRVIAQTLARAERLGLQVALLPPWYDVDTPADLAQLRAELDRLGPDRLVHTRRFLESHAASA